MRYWTALAAVGALFVLPCPAPAGAVEEQPVAEAPPAESAPEEVPADEAQPAHAKRSKVRPPVERTVDDEAEADDDEPSDYELLDEHMDAIRDYQDAETDEQAEKAKKRFQDAEAREMKTRREKLNRLMER